MKKTLWVLLCALVVSATVISPSVNVDANSELEKINRELNALKRQKAAAEQKARQTQQELRAIQSQKQDTASDIKTLLR